MSVTSGLEALTWEPSDSGSQRCFGERRCGCTGNGVLVSRGVAVLGMKDVSMSGGVAALEMVFR